MTSAPTFLGLVGTVTGGTVSVRQSESVASGTVIIGGTAYRVGQVGSFVRIPQGYQDLFGVVSEVGASATPEALADESAGGDRWMTVQLVGESVGATFERGLSQYPNVNDEVHIVTERELRRVYGDETKGQVAIGRLANSESMIVRIDLEKVVTRHAAIVGSTGAGKSTTVASILRSIASSGGGGDAEFPNARIILFDIHGEYAHALRDVARVYRIAPNRGEEPLHIPYWALDPNDLFGFLFGTMDERQKATIFDLITESKIKSFEKKEFSGVSKESITSATPIPYSLKKLWATLIGPELMTLEGPQRDQPALIEEGDAETLKPPKYKPHAMGAQGPFLNQAALGVRRQLGLLRSRLLDHAYDFLLHPGEWEPDLDGDVASDLDKLLGGWLGHSKPITILDLSGIPSDILDRLLGAVLRIIYESMFWSRDKSEGARERPLLIVMEEAHRYLSGEGAGVAREMVQRLVKEGRKYGMGAVLVSQRPSEIDETILSQCGTFITMRLSNPRDRSRVQGALPDSLTGLMDMLPVLRTGETIVTGEAARLPLRCRVFLPSEEFRPDSRDPEVTETWGLAKREEDYGRVVASWRAQNPRYTEVEIARTPVEDQPE